MITGGLPIAFGAGVTCCWVQGSDSVPYATVETKLTSTILRDAK